MDDDDVQQRIAQQQGDQNSSEPDAGRPDEPTGSGSIRGGFSGTKGGDPGEADEANTGGGPDR